VSTTTITQELQKPTGILALLQPIEDQLSKAKTSLRQMSRVIIAMSAMTGRVTMLVLSRWAGESSSYRTIQHFYNTAIPWSQVNWQFFFQHLFRKDEVYILAGDECVASKAEKKTFGLDRFFSGVQQKVILGAVLLCDLGGLLLPEIPNRVPPLAFETRNSSGVWKIL